MIKDNANAANLWDDNLYLIKLLRLINLVNWLL